MNKTGLLEKIQEMEREMMEGRLNKTEFLEEMKEIK